MLVLKVKSGRKKVLFYVTKNDMSFNVYVNIYSSGLIFLEEMSTCFAGLGDVRY